MTWILLSMFKKINHDCRAICFEPYRKKINSDHVLVIHGIEKVYVVVDTISGVFELFRTRTFLNKCRFYVIDETDHESDNNKGNNNQNDILKMNSR